MKKKKKEEVIVDDEVMKGRLVSDSVLDGSSSNMMPWNPLWTVS